MAKTKGGKRKINVSRKMRIYVVQKTIEAIKRIEENGEKIVFLPYADILVNLEAKPSPYLWDALIFFQALGWEKAEIGSDKFLVLREHNKDVAKERVKSIIEAIQKKARSR